jgi:AraC-like DNA-binding protein
MRSTREVDDFLKSPLGAALIGDGFVYAHPIETFFVTALYGRPNAANAAPLLRALRVELERRIKPHVSLVDARRVEGVDGDAFSALATYVKREREGLAQKVTRLCLLRPEGLSGAVVAGFFAVVDPPYPVLVATTLQEATSFLTPEVTPVVIAELDALVTSVADRPRVVVDVERVLRELGFDAELPRVARALALSPRTLQRRLADAGTSFIDLARRARLQEAERRLRETSDSITAIALDCGWSSAQHFAADFRAAHGVTPSSWRRS